MCSREEQAPPLPQTLNFADGRIFDLTTKQKFISLLRTKIIPTPSGAKRPLGSLREGAGTPRVTEGERGNKNQKLDLLRHKFMLFADKSKRLPIFSQAPPPTTWEPSALVASIACFPLWLKICHRHIFLTRHAHSEGALTILSSYGTVCA